MSIYKNIREIKTYKGIVVFCIFFSFNSCNSADQSFELKTSITPNDGGIVTPVDTVLVEGSHIDLVATPADGYRFVEWVGDVSDSTNPLTIKIDENLNIVGVFTEREYPLNITIEGEGTVIEEILPQKVSDYEYGTIIRLTAQALEGWGFKEWKGDNIGNQNPITIEMDSDKEIRAVFERTIFLVRGRVFDVYRNDTLQFQPSRNYFRVDGIEIPVDLDGTFEFEVEKGERTIQMEGDSKHHSYNKSITFNQDMKDLHLNVLPKYYDFYDPNPGREKEWSFNSSVRDSEHLTITKLNMDWKILYDSLSTETSNIIYVVENKSQGTRVSKIIETGDYTPVIHIDDTSYFNIETLGDTAVIYHKIKYLEESIGYQAQKVASSGLNYSGTIYRCYPASRVGGYIEVTIREDEVVDNSFILKQHRGLTEYKSNKDDFSNDNDTTYYKSLFLEDVEYYGSYSSVCNTIISGM